MDGWMEERMTRTKAESKTSRGATDPPLEQPVHPRFASCLRGGEKRGRAMDSAIVVLTGVWEDVLGYSVRGSDSARTFLPQNTWASPGFSSVSGEFSSVSGEHRT